MKHFRYLLAALSVSASLLFFGAAPAAAQYNMMGPGQSSSDTSASDTSTSDTASEQQGQAIYNQLQNKQTTCSKLTDNDFAALGDFYMSRMMGSAHDAMDQYMTQELGTSGDRQAHIAIGERLSGCNTNASYPTSSSDYAPLAWMGTMGTNSGNWSGMNGYRTSSWTAADTVLVILLVLAIAAALLAWLRPRRSYPTTNPLDTLKSRYVKGEIDKKEFEEKRKALK